MEANGADGGQRCEKEGKFGEASQAVEGRRGGALRTPIQTIVPVKTAPYAHFDNLRLGVALAAIDSIVLLRHLADR